MAALVVMEILVSVVPVDQVVVWGRQVMRAD
jgi:hypothetical protein